MATQDLEFKILAKVVGANAVDDLKKSVESVGKAASGLETLTGAVKGLVAAFAIKEAAGFAKSLIDSADNMRDFSQKTQISVKDLSGFQVAAEQSGTNLEGLGSAFSKLNKTMVAAAGGNKTAAQAFSNLGISIKDANGEIKPTGDVVKELADKFADLKDTPEKAAAAIAIFGKAGSDMIPFLNNGSEALTKFSGLISDDFANRSDQLNDSLATLKAKGLGEFYGALEAGMPALQQTVDYFTGMDKNGSVLKVSITLIAEAVRDLVLATNTLLLPLRQAGDVLFYTFAQIGSHAIEWLNKISLGLLFLGNSSLAVLKGKMSSIPDLYKQLGNDVTAIDKKAYQQRIENQDEFLKRFGDRNKSYHKMMMSPLRKDSLLFGDGGWDETLKRQKDHTAPSVSKPTSRASAPDDIDEKVKKREAELETIKALRESGLQQVALDRIQADSYKYSKLELEKLTETKKSEIEVTKATKHFTEEGTAAYKAAAEEVLQAKLALSEFKEKQKESFSVGAQQGLREYASAAADAAAQMKAAFMNAFKGLEDSLVNFVKTGKLNFRSLANSIIDDMIRIAIRQSITGPLAAGLGGMFGPGAAAGASYGGAAATSSLSPGTLTSGFANGGIMTSGGSLQLSKYSNGGIANKPQLALYGEGRTPEAYVPLPDGRSIPVTMQGRSGGGNSTSVMVNVNVESGNTNNQASSESGKQLGTLISNVVKQVLIDQKRPGGLLA